MPTETDVSPQEQAPLTQLSPASGQAWPQAPQLAGAVAKAVQKPPHAFGYAVGHAHWPALQICPPPQAFPQAPQLATSTLVSAQADPQWVSTAGQITLPLVELQAAASAA